MLETLLRLDTETPAFSFSILDLRLPTDKLVRRDVLTTGVAGEPLDMDALAGGC